MTIEIIKNDIQDLIIQGTKDAIDFEMQRLHDEAKQIFVSKDRKVDDAMEKMEKFP